jgi:hypothetical protein
MTIASFPDPKKVSEAEAEIAEFETSSVPGLWTAVSKPQILAEMRSRVRDPFKINQGRQPFCGPASIVFELVRKNPVRYVKICRSIYEIGGFQGQTQWIKASDRLPKSQGELQMPQADWMVLATLREAENLIFPIDPNAPETIRNLSGMTKSWEIAGWMKEVLGYTRVRYRNAYIMGDLKAMQESDFAIQSGGVGFALITAEGLLLNKPPKIPYPSHWIVLLGNLETIAENQIGFDIYTWGRKMTVKTDLKSLKKYLWGVVFG